MKYNILFTDFDGVINCVCEEREKEHLCLLDTFNHYHPKLVENLKAIIHEYDFKLVISSTWRKDYSIQKMNYILNEVFKLDCTILDYTTKKFLDIDYRERLEWDPNSIPRDRGLQISQWLNEEKYDINYYVVLDDDIDAKYGHENNYFGVNSMFGLDDTALHEFEIFMKKLLNSGE